MTGATLRDRLRLLVDRPAAIPLLLFGVTCLFRALYMNAGLFHFDEVATAIAVEDSVASFRLAGEVSGRYGAVLLNLLFFLPYHLAGGGGAEPVLLFTSALAGSLLVAVFFLLVRELTDSRQAALFSALFLAFNFLFLTTSTTGKEQTPQLLFLVLSLWLTARGIRLDRLATRLAAAAAFAFSLTIHEGGIVLIPVFLAFIVSLNLARNAAAGRIARDLALFLAIAAMPFALYLGALVASNLGSRGENTAGFMGLRSPMLHHAAADLERLGGPLLLLAVPGLLLLARRMSRFLPVAAWLGLFFYYANISSYTARDLAYLLPPLSMAGGVAVAHFLALARERRAMQAVAGGLAVALVCGYGIAMARPLVAFRAAYCGPKEAAIFVRDRTEPDAIVLAADEAIHIRYYARRATRSHPVDELAPIRAFVDEMAGLVRAGKKVYVTTSAYNYDRNGYFRVLMSDRFALVPVGEVVDEDYHRPELSFQKYRARLYRMLPAGTAQSVYPPPSAPDPEDL